MKRIFISLDYEHDADQQFMVTALKAASNERLQFNSVSPHDVGLLSVEQMKGVLQRRIEWATHTLVIVGEHANTLDQDAVAIGHHNWQAWELAYSIERRRKIVAVRVKSTVESPELLRGLGVTWAYSFNVVTIIKAIDRSP